MALGSINPNTTPLSCFQTFSFTRNAKTLAMHPNRSTLLLNSGVQLRLTAVADARPASALAEVWREIQGSENWMDLVNPLDPLLRDEIIRYRDFIDVCNKAFDLDPASKHHLTCKHGKKKLLYKAGLENSGYEITKYIYATPGIAVLTQTPRSRWIGFVAVSSDAESRRLGRRDIVVTFRGTATATEWIAGFMSSLVPARLDPHNPMSDVKVKSGFLGLYTSDDSTSKFSHGSCREQLLWEVSRLVQKYKNEEVSITLAGQSTGSSLAVLFGYDVAELGLNLDGWERKIPITVYSFEGPKVGNVDFKERCEELGVKALRVVNVKDPATKVLVFVLERFRVLAEKYKLPWSCSCSAHVGVELDLS